MDELSKKILEAKNEKQRMKNDIDEHMTVFRIKQAELSLIEKFIDELNDLDSKINSTK